MNQPNVAKKRLLKETDVYSEYGIPVPTLQTKRVRGGGPPFVRLGRSVLYDRRDLESWIDANRCTSTSDVKAGA